MAALAVGVVGDEVERADLLEPRVVLRALEQGEVVLLEVGMDEGLERPRAVRSLAQDRGRDEPPAECLGEAVGGDLALVETGREVPERPLAALGFVDGERRFPGEGQLGEQGDVAGRWHPALDGDGAPVQELKRRA